MAAKTGAITSEFHDPDVRCWPPSPEPGAHPTFGAFYNDLSRQLHIMTPLKQHRERLFL